MIEFKMKMVSNHQENYEVFNVEYINSFKTGSLLIHFSVESLWNKSLTIFSSFFEVRIFDNVTIFVLCQVVVFFPIIYEFLFRQLF